MNDNRSRTLLVRTCESIIFNLLTGGDYLVNSFFEDASALDETS